MAILKIARMGHPVLLRRADPVPDPIGPDISRLIADMIETMEDAGGAGLAAPQVHVSLRLVVFRVPAHRASGAADDVPMGVTALINPVVEPLGEETMMSWEGCLSIPGMRGAIRRPARVRYTGMDQDGQPVAREVGGFHARVVQHEYDHLDGILYPMRMTDFSLFGFNEELDRVAQAQAQAQAQAAGQAA